MYGTGSVNIWKTSHKISADIRTFFTVQRVKLSLHAVIEWPAACDIVMSAIERQGDIEVRRSHSAALTSFNGPCVSTLRR